MRRNPSGELPGALPIWEATKALSRLDGFKPTDTERDGVITWHHVEGATAADYMAKFSSEEGLLSAANPLI